MEGIWKKWNEWKKEGKFRKWLTRDNFLILVLSGVLLMIVTAPSGAKEGTEKDTFPSKETSDSEGDLSVGLEQGSGGSHDQEDYVKYLEERLVGLLSSMEGVGKVNVMITLRSSEELILEKDGETVSSATLEEDGEGGSRSVRETESRESAVYKTEGNVQEPCVVKTLTPAIEGVVVAAQGAGTKRITADITEAVQALFGIEAHKVKVIQRKAGE